MRIASLLVITALIGTFPQSAIAQAGQPRVVAGRQGAPPALPDRAIRGTIPMTNVIQRAFAAGTRDSSGRPGPKYWQLWNEYTIKAKLDAPASILSGTETIIIHNTSDTPLPQIRMRLDQNIFTATAPRSPGWTPGEITEGFQFGKISVNGVAANLSTPAGGRGGRGGGGGAAPTVATAFGFNTTLGTIALPTPVPAHGEATVELEFSYKIPGGNRTAHRTSMRWGDSLVQMTQWYPRVAVYDDLRGWDPEPYLGTAEFFHDFGHFDVSLDLPAGWIAGATGVLRNPEQVLTATARERLSQVLASDSTRTIVGASEFGPGKATQAGDRLVWHFVADTANDFAWVASRSFIWEATRATIPTRGPIPVNIFYTPGRTAAFAGIGPTLRHALEFYSKLYLPYPFPVHNAADGPDDGMEYPMIVMSSRGAADHETAHEWWPMTVSNNETWYGWMDEGFDQYMNILSDADLANRAPVLDGNGQFYGRFSGNESESTMMWDMNYGGPQTGFVTYNKTPLMLSMLGGIVGDSAVWQAQSDWAKAWRFKHPSPWDFMFFMNNALHRDLSWFWYYWLFTTESVNGSIAQVHTTPAGAATEVTVHQAGEMPSPVVLKVVFDPKGPAIKVMSNAKMIDSITAVVTWPVDVWFTGRRDFVAPLTFGARTITRIVLDPACRLPDKDPSDNIWPRAPAAAPAAAPPGGRGGGRGGASCVN